MVSQLEINEYIDEKLGESTTGQDLLAWLVLKFEITSEQAWKGLEKWVEQKQLDIEKDYQMKLEDVSRDHFDKLEKLATQFPSRIDSPPKLP